jgi:hypothetical protein
MSRAMKRRMGAASLVVGIALLAALAIRSPWASAQTAVEDAQPSADAAQCGGGPAVFASPDTEILTLMQQDLANVQPETDPGSDYVVLNNRGYNYGPPPGVRFDALIPAGEPNPNQGAR